MTDDAARSLLVAEILQAIVENRTRLSLPSAPKRVLDQIHMLERELAEARADKALMLTGGPTSVVASKAYALDEPPMFLPDEIDVRFRLVDHGDHWISVRRDAKDSCVLVRGCDAISLTLDPEVANLVRVRIR